MRRKLRLVLLIGLSLITFAQIRPSASSEQLVVVKGRTSDVQQTVGDTTNDGLSPMTAWRDIHELSTTLEAGDAASKRLSVGVEAVSNTFDGSARSECAAQDEVEAGKKHEMWVAFGGVKVQAEQGWQAAEPAQAARAARSCK